jgi:hypothetical protein
MRPPGRIERVVLGTLMAAAAFLIERRLRKILEKRGGMR